MVNEYLKELIAKRIAGDIVLSNNYGSSLRKWREIFKSSQLDIARIMGISASVISDYEKNRRTPGAKFIRKYVDALLTIDGERGWTIIKELAKNLNLLYSTAILDVKELNSPIKLDVLLNVVEGLIVNSYVSSLDEIYGYTVIDSLEAIEGLSGNEFWQIMGMNTRRALIFTKVSTGRSPMIAVRVAPAKPAVIVLHGPKRVDPLAIKLADREGVPLILSMTEDVDILINNLRSVTLNLP
ncbi:MAG: helix-turn-helix domain-containing protein [Sulfolobales archaeon]